MPPSPRSARHWITTVCLLLAVSRPAALSGADRWPEERTVGNFLCHADFSLQDYQPLLEELGSLQHDLTQTLGVEPSREPVHLFLFHQKSSYQGYLRLYFPKVPYRRALFIKERGPGMVFAYRSPELEVDVRHEGTHALLHGSLPFVSLWLDEGLAEYFEVDASKRVYENPYLSSVKWQVRLGQVPRIEDLEEITDLRDMGRGEYRQAWAWVHFMLHGSPEAHDELVRFLGDIQAHTPPGKLSERLRRRLPNLERLFAEHFKNWKQP